MDEERAAADGIVLKVNKKVGRQFDLHVDLNKWEDRGPGFGRPQELINMEMVDQCDLFIGLVGKRWGSAPGAGTCTSGFQEEYERAKLRRQRDGSPEIWLFFKKVDSESLNDPGAQLTEVLRFRDSQKSLHEVFYKEVTSTEEWKNGLFQDLTEHVVKLGMAVGNLREESPAAAPALTDEDNPQNESGASAIPARLSELPVLLKRVFDSGGHPTGKDAVPRG